MSFIPSLLFVTLFTSFFAYFRGKNFFITKALVLSHWTSFLIISLTSKFIILSKIIDYTKVIVFFYLISSIFAIFFYKKIIKTDIIAAYKLIVKNNYLKLFLIIFIYIFTQSIFLPPSNFDSLAYHIQRNYLFINEGTIYPIKNSYYENQVFQPLNSDLLFFFHAIFKSNIFMNVFSLNSLIIIISLIYFFLKYLKNNQKNINFILIIFFSFSSIILASTSTKNDIIILAIALSVIFIFQDYILRKKESSLIFFFIISFFGLGIKWNFIFFLFPFFIFGLYLIYKKKIFFQTLKILFYTFPILLFIGPFEILYLNFTETGNFFGIKDHFSGHTNPDGIKGFASNLIRNFFLLFDITLPIQYFSNDLFITKYNNFLNHVLFLLFDDNKLGIAKNIKWLEFDYAYTLKPHIDYTGYSIFGFFVTVLSFFYIFKGKNILLKTFAFISSFYLFFICYFFTWQPWILRFFMITIVINLIVSSEYLNKVSKKNRKIISIMCAFILTFNVLANIPQPLIKHSKTPSWMNSMINRHQYQTYSIPDMIKIDRYLKMNFEKQNIIIVIDNVASQNPYEILRRSKNNYYKFVNYEFKDILSKQKTNIKIDNFTYILNLSNKKLKKINNYIEIVKKDNDHFQLLKKIEN